MSVSSVNLGTEQPVKSVDREMPDAPGQIVDIEMTGVSQDRNVVSSEDGIEQFGRGRPPTSSADQGNLYNSSDDVSRGGESILHGPEDLTPEASNRGGIVAQWNIARVYHLGPHELAAFNAIRAAKEHQCSPGFDGEDTIMVDNDGYECEFCKACEEYQRTADQDNVYWSTVPS
ncbi:uncharacterized protein FPRN_15125 [Fusarium proliferatum]|nr:uncharacterized protein FPRN_15125 [Fusarium proliferatum]